MDTSDNKVKKRDVFIAINTALIPGTNLNSYVGQINGTGPKMAAVLKADFIEALTGDRRVGLRRVFGQTSLKPYLNLDEICGSIFPLEGEHSGKGNPEVIIHPGISTISDGVIQAATAGALKKGSRPQMAAVELAKMQRVAAAEGWRVAIFAANNLNPHRQIETPPTPLQLLVAQNESKRLDLEMKRVDLDKKRLSIDRTESLHRRRLDRAKALDDLCETRRKAGQLTPAMEVDLKTQAAQIRLGRKLKPTKKRVPLPRGWMTMKQIAKRLGPWVHHQTVKSMIDEMGTARKGGGNGTPIKGRSIRYDVVDPDASDGYRKSWGFSPGVADEVVAYKVTYLNHPKLSKDRRDRWEKARRDYYKLIEGGKGANRNPDSNRDAS